MDEIKQTIGFDAGPALEALATLDRALATLQKAMDTSVQSLDRFNKMGGKTVAALRQIESAATRAAQGLDRVANLQSAVSKAAAAEVRKATEPLPPPDLSAYVNAIKQQFGEIPKTASVSTQRAYQSAVAGAAAYAQRTGMSLEQLQHYANNLGGAFTGAGNTMANKLGAVNRTLQQMQGHVQHVTVDFKTMVRIVTTQAIVRALSTLRDALRGAVRDTIEFKRRVAEIGTISGKNPDLGAIEKQVLDLSNALNQPFETVAAGYYQALSQQVGGAAEALEVLATSGKFAKVSVAGVDASIILITSAINAFGMHAGDAERIAAQFFKTIELGQTRAEELVTSFGQTMPVAAELGVALEELQASLASITIGGQNTARASTEIRALMSGMIKPSEAMGKALRNLGFESAQEMVATYGLVDALQLLREEVGGSVADMARLFPNVRALNAALRLTSEEGATKFREAMEELKDYRGILDQKWELVMETDTEKLTRQLNELRNFFASEFGIALIKTANQLFAFAGGADTLTRALRAMAVPATAAVGIIGALGLAYTASAARAQFFTTTLANGTKQLTAAGAAITYVGAALGAWAAGNYIGTSIFDAMSTNINAMKKLLDKQAELETKLARARIDEQKDTNAILIREHLKLVNVQKGTYFEDVANARRALSAKEAAYKQSMDSIVNWHQSRVQKMLDTEKKAVREIENSIRRTDNLRTTLDDKLFHRRIDPLDDAQKYTQLLTRSQQIASEAARKLGAAKTSDEFQSADEDFRRADALLDQAHAVGKQAENRAMMNRVDQASIDLVNKRIAAERQYQKTQAEYGKQAAGAARRGQEDAWKLEAAQKRAAEALKTLSEKDISEKTKKRAFADLSAGLAEFHKLAIQGEKLSVAELLSFGELKHEVLQQLGSIEVQGLHAAPEAVAALAKDIEIQLASLNQKMPYKPDVELVTGTKIESKADYAEGLKAAQERHADLLELQEALRKAHMDAWNADLVVQEGLSKLPTFQEKFPVNTLFGGTTEAIDEVAVKFNQMIEKIKTAAADPAIKITALEELKRDLASFAKNDTRWFPDLQETSALLEMGKAVDAMLQKAKAAEQIKANPFNAASPDPAVLEQWNALQRIFQGLKLEAQNTETSVKATDNSLSSAVQSAWSLADAFANAAWEAQNMATAAGANVGYAAHGGLMRQGPVSRIARYFDRGGFANRGADIIPAMLSPNEFVVNPRSTRRFFSQLQAINAGVRPVYRDSGGSVTNIGDINVTVKGGDSSRQTARQIANELRRELRRGTARL